MTYGMVVHLLTAGGGRAALGGRVVEGGVAAVAAGLELG